jgi:C-terminal processing protease CtpA/Prc
MGFGTISAGLDAADLRGKPITFRAAVKADHKSRAQLWLRVDRPAGTMGFFDNMGDRPILSTHWRNYEIAGTVDSDAVRISFGCMLMGAGQLWVDDLHILIGEGIQQNEIKLADADFENDAPGSLPQGWISRTPGYVVEVTSETASAGKKSVSLKAALIELPAELFPERVGPGEVIPSALPGGIACTVPLTLFADSIGTIPRTDKNHLDRFINIMENTLPNRLSGKDRIVRLADIVIAWNVFQHFYPYFDETDVDWGAQLPGALRQAWDDDSELSFLKTLQRFVAGLRDGHGRAALVSDTSESFVPPMQWTWVENALVVTDIFDSSGTGPNVGDIVTTVDGIPADRALKDEEAYVSGATPQWRRLGAAAGLLSGPRNSPLRLTTVSSDGRSRNVALARTLSMMQHFTFQKGHQRPTAKLTQGVYYLNLSSSSMTAIDSLMPELATARGVICDLRGYPNGNHGLISHLLTQPDTSTHWMGIPKTIYPDRKRPLQYSYSGWNMQPLQPHISGRVVFLTDGRAISYAESYMSFIEHYKLADIVGEPTAGTNGNVNPFPLPGGYRLMWTGMRVTKHGGSRHHGVGIQPTLVIHPTIKGIREGRDEQLEAALALITEASR